MIPPKNTYARSSPSQTVSVVALTSIHLVSMRTLRSVSRPAASACEFGSSAYSCAEEDVTARFELGVASGAPLPDAVILWIRVTPDGGDRSTSDGRFEANDTQSYDLATGMDLTRRGFIVLDARPSACRVHGFSSMTSTCACALTRPT